MTSDEQEGPRHEPLRLIRVTFNNADEFLHELLARGPDVEPVLRATLRWQCDGEGAPVHHLSVVASYLRRVAGDVVAVTELEHYVGPVWSGLDDPGSRRCRASAQALLAVLDSASRDLGLSLARGVYRTQPDRAAGVSVGGSPEDAGAADRTAGSGRGDSGGS